MSGEPAQELPGTGVDPRVARAGRWGGFALFLALLLVPGLGLDPLQRRAAAVTALTATLWLTQGIPLGAASLIPAALLPLLGVVPAQTAAEAYFHDIVMLFFGAFVVASGLEHWGVHRRMALWVVERVGTRPRALVLGFTAATAFVSLWVNNTAATLLMYPIGLAVITTLGGARNRNFGIALLLGIAYGSSIGGIGTPVGTAPNQLLLGTLAKLHPGAPPIGFGTWVACWLPFVVLFVLALWWILTRGALKVSDESLAAKDVIHAQRAGLGAMGPGERRMAAVFVLTALAWVTREGLTLGSWHLPGWNPALANLQALGLEGGPQRFKGFVSDATVAIFVSCACFLIPAGTARGERLLDWGVVQRKTPWDMLLLFGGGLCIAEGFQACGLDRVLGASLSPLIAGLPTWLIVGVIALFLTLFSELASNTVLTSLMLPILSQTAVQGGLDPRLLMIPAAVAASLGFMLPVATPPNAIAFASGRIPMGTMLRVGLWVDAVGVVLLTVCFELWIRSGLGIEAGLPDWARP